MGSPIKKPTSIPEKFTKGKPSNRPAAKKATEKAIKAVVAVSKSRDIARNPASEKDMDQAFALRTKGRKMAKQSITTLEKTKSNFSKSPNNVNKTMQKRIIQSKKARGK